MLAKLHPRGRGRDGLEFTTQIDRSLRLGIEGLEVAHAAPSVDDDAGLGRGGRREGGVTGLQKSREGKTGQTHARTQKIPSRMTDTQHL